MPASQTPSSPPGASSASLIGDAGWLPPTPARSANLGTFVGVLRPTLLTIIGLVLYLRQGWVVGNAGLLGGLALVLLTFSITGATSLSIAAIATNMRLGAGGAFAMISRALGLEAGGAIGIPLYLAQAMSVAFYMYGFAEGWLYLFPDHDRTLALWAVYVCGFGLSMVSEKLALRSQALVMFGVALALICIWSGIATADELHAPQWIGGFEDAGFWDLFAVFFPAGTGIMVGVGLSGKLREPRRSIPRGILGAWGIALGVYLLTLLWYAVIAAPADLRADPLTSIHRAAWSPGVLIGLMSSCFSAMLGSVLAGPNILAALARERLVPFADTFASDGTQTPRAALMLTGVLVAAAILVGDLNRVAGLITMFFLISYAVINVIVLVEQQLKMISFRPTLPVPKFVPLFGAVASVAVMLVTYPMVGLLALLVVVAIYVFLTRRHLETPWETVRSGMVTAIADWVTKASQRIAGPQYRAWKPELLLPSAPGEAPPVSCALLGALLRPRGGLLLLAVHAESAPRRAPPALAPLLEELRCGGLGARYAAIEAPSLLVGCRSALDVLGGALSRPNILFVDGAGRSEVAIQELVRLARRQDIGFVLHLTDDGAREPPAILKVNLWVRDQSPNWRLGLQLANLDLPLLLGHQLQRNSGGRLRLVSVIRRESDLPAGRHYLRRMRDEARLGAATELWVETGDFATRRRDAPAADVNIFGIPEHVDLAELGALRADIGGICLFVHDSSQESALA
ncbi:MAG: hypothetical protein KC486_20730 [Myxococcales bacterium]|nr:hypothetical protein [Myxococcales bacterium]